MQMLGANLLTFSALNTILCLSFALRWVGSLPNVKVVLSGMSTMEQVEDNLRTFAEFRPLSEKEEKTIEDIVALIKKTS